MRTCGGVFAFTGLMVLVMGALLAVRASEAQTSEEKPIELEATKGVPYAVALEAALPADKFWIDPQRRPLKWKLLSAIDQLPKDIEFDEKGFLTGTPLHAQKEPYRFTVEFKDSWTGRGVEDPIKVTFGLYVSLPPIRRGSSPGQPIAHSPSKPIIDQDGDNQPDKEIPHSTRVVKGKAQKGAEIELIDKDHEQNVLGKGRMDDSTGEFEIELKGDLSVGHKLIVKQTVGTTATESAAVTVILGPPKLKTPIVSGDVTVQGTAFPGSKVEFFVEGKRVGVLVKETKTVDGKEEEVEKEEVALDSKSKEFSAKLKEGLQAYQRVQAKQTTDGDVQMSKVVVVSPQTAPEIVGVLKEGQRKVSVQAQEGAKIEVRIDDKLQKGKVLADQADPKSYEVELERPLAAGQKITAGVANGEKSDPTTVQASGFSWGRVRGYFTAGGIFSKERGNFSQNDFFLGLNVDKNWRWIDARDEEERKKDRRLFPWIGFNTYFDGRLTSIPVSEPDSEATDTTTGDAGGSNGNGSTGDNGTPGTGDSLNTFLASEKAALFQLGAYAPIRTTIWEHDGRPNTVFVAPIAKAGIQTITGEAQTVEAETFGQDDVFNFFALGIRIGHYKHSRTRNVGPQLISYLDITRGKWENFDLQENMNADSENTMAVRRRQWRWGFEGRLKIPGAPFQVGFDGNFGKGRDDLRILFGTNFDIGEVFNRLQSSQSDE